MKGSKKPVVVEVPLLFEAKFERDFDVTLFMFAPSKDRLTRVKKRGMNPRLFKFLDRRQLSAAEKSERADFILHNTTKAFLKKQVKWLARVLRELAKN